MQQQKHHYTVSLVIGNKHVEIHENIVPNYEGGEPKQLAVMFYRALLAGGFTPGVACHALGRIAVAGGYTPDSLHTGTRESKVIDIHGKEGA